MFTRRLTVMLLMFWVVVLATAADAKPQIELSHIVTPWVSNKLCHVALDQCGKQRGTLAKATMDSCWPFKRCIEDCRSKTFELKRKPRVVKSCNNKCTDEAGQVDKACMQACGQHTKRRTIKKRGRRKCRVACKAQFKAPACAESRTWLWDKSQQCIVKTAPECAAPLKWVLKHPWPPKDKSPIAR